MAGVSLDGAALRALSLTLKNVNSHNRAVELESCWAERRLDSILPTTTATTTTAAAAAAAPTTSTIYNTIADDLRLERARNAAEKSLARGTSALATSWDVRDDNRRTVTHVLDTTNDRSRSRSRSAEHRSRRRRRHRRQHRRRHSDSDDEIKNVEDVRDAASIIAADTSLDKIGARDTITAVPLVDIEQQTKTTVSIP